MCVGLYGIILVRTFLAILAGVVSTRPDTSYAQDPQERVKNEIEISRTSRVGELLKLIIAVRRVELNGIKIFNSEEYLIFSLASYTTNGNKRKSIVFQCRFSV